MKQFYINSSVKNSGIIYWITAFWLYLLLFPYFIWPVAEYSSWLLSLPLFILFFLHQSKKINLSFFLFYAAICLIAALCGGSNFLGIIMFMTTAFFFSTDDYFLINVYKKYRLIFIFFITLSLIVYALVALGVPLSYRVSPPPPRNTIDYDFYIYPFYANPSVLDWRDLIIERFNGLFDEPGTVGTSCMLLLFIEKFNFRKVGNIILLIAGLLSFSLYFYGVLFIALSFRLFTGKAEVRTKVIYALFILAGLYATSQNELTNQLIWKRFEWDKSERTIVGDDRSDYELTKYVKSVRGTSAYFWGSPDKLDSFQGSASLEKEIVAHGFVVVALFFVFYALFSLKYMKFSREWILFYIVFVATLYNRPSFFSYERLLMFNMAIFAYSIKYRHYFDNIPIPQSTGVVVRQG